MLYKYVFFTCQQLLIPSATIDLLMSRPVSLDTLIFQNLQKSSMISYFTWLIFYFLEDKCLGFDVSLLFKVFMALYIRQLSTLRIRNGAMPGIMSKFIFYSLLTLDQEGFDTYYLFMLICCIVFLYNLSHLGPGRVQYFENM